MISYTNGKPMPPNVLASIKYVAKVGIISTQQWQQNFGRGNLRWKQKQLQSLTKKELLKRHSSTWNGFWVLGSKGKELAQRIEYDPVTPVLPTYFEHDMFLGESMIKFEKARLTEFWATEKELKQESYDEFEVRTRDTKIKFTDINSASTLVIPQGRTSCGLGPILLLEVT